MKEKESIKWVHLIGICGVAMAPVANMFKEMGWFVSGSDKGIFPPMSDYLKERGIDIELGSKEKHLTRNYYKKEKSVQSEIGEYPDVVVVGNFFGLNNPEYKFTKKNNLRMMSYPDVFEEYLIKSNSIVVAGTYGKTTSSALLSLIFQKAGKNPSFMVGGIAKNFDNGVVNTDSLWSILEGDEYISARFDPVSKFFHYKPEFLLLTACAWEHTDIFKTEKAYVDNFKKLVGSLPKNGLVVANKNGKNVDEVLTAARCKVVTYEFNKVDDKIVEADWFNLSHNENKGTGEIIIFNKHTKEEFTVSTELIGNHNKENIVGCCALARELYIGQDSVIEGVKSFEGIVRRLEVIYEEEYVKVLADHACSPPKILGSLSALRDTFTDWHITIISEPNVGNRTKDSLPLFEGIYKDADEVIIPHLKMIRTPEGEERVSGKELVEYLGKDIDFVQYIEDDNKLVKYVSGKDVGKHIICFMSASSFRGMVEQVVNILKNRK